jgi:hypothetical protein
VSPRVLPAAALLVLLLAVPGAARAGLEEFSTFDAEEQERDDESLLDHLLTRMPRAWRDEWERAPLGLRSAQGCLTSGQWFNQTDLKVRASLGRRAWFGFTVRQDESDRMIADYTEFSFHVPTRYGTAGWMFRPSRDKSSQDMALMWDVGADTSTFQLRAAFGLEDVFNNFWEFRQANTGGRSEPYLRHPWEPSLRMVVRRPALRAEVGGRYLSPGTKRVGPPVGTSASDRLTTLWGALGWASVEARALGLEWEARGTNHQASSTDRPVDVPAPDGRDFRRQWSVETALRRAVTPRLTAEGRWVYQERTQDHAPPVFPSRFDAVDRVIQLEALWTPSPAWGLRLGWLHDHITVVQSGTSLEYSFGTRREARAYLGLLARFGRVSLQLVEGIELDREPYDVWFVHDKGFVQLQAVF